MFFSSCTNVKIGLLFGQDYLYWRYPIPAIATYILLSLTLYLIIGAGDIPAIGVIVTLILWIVFFIINLIMNLILRLKYVEHSQIEESVCKSLSLMIFCRPCAYGEMGNYIKINHENNNAQQSLNL